MTSTPIDKTKDNNGLLILILLVGAMVRFWAIDFGLPNIKCRPDESYIINTAIKFGSGDLNPHSFLYPSLYFYLLFWLFIVYCSIGLLTGRFASTDDFLYEYATDPSNFYLISRCFTALLGSATVYFVYALAKKAFGQKTALVSAFLLSVCYLHVRDSHFATTDVPTTFFVVSAVYFIVCLRHLPSLKNYLITGSLIGLAASSKYNGILLLVPLVWSHWLANKSNQRILEVLFSSKLIWAIVASGMVFFITSPYVILDFKAFLSDFLFQLHHFKQGHVLKAGIGYIYHIKFSLFYGMGWPLLLAAVAGLFIQFRSNFRLFFEVFGFLILYFFIVGSGYSLFVRYVIPLLPFLCISAAIFAVWLSDVLQKFRDKTGILPVILIAPLISSISIFQSFSFDYLLSKKDNRLIAYEWAIANIPSGSSIYQPASWGEIYFPPDTATLKHELIQEENLVKKRILNRRLDTKPMGFKAIEMASGDFIWQNEHQTSLPEYIIIERFPLIFLTRIPDTIPKILKEKYQLVRYFKAIELSDVNNQFDQEDAFYAPYTGFTNVDRFGPNLEVYQIKN